MIRKEGSLFTPKFGRRVAALLNFDPIAPVNF